MAVRTEDNVYECDGISSPFVFGILRPRIYVPCGMPRDQREMVVLHEKCHLKRKDHLVKLLSFVLLGIYWFHPLVWIGWRCMCGDMEMSCDEAVLKRLGEGVRAVTLMDCVELAVDAGQISASMIQRKHRVGYARAGRLIDDMAARGIVSPSEGAKPREVLMTREQFHQMFGE